MEEEEEKGREKKRRGSGKDKDLVDCLPPKYRSIIGIYGCWAQWHKPVIPALGSQGKRTTDSGQPGLQIMTLSQTKQDKQTKSPHDLI